MTLIVILEEQTATSGLLRSPSETEITKRVSSNDEECIFFPSVLNSCFRYEFSSKIRVCFHSVLLYASENIATDLGDYFFKKSNIFKILLLTTSTPSLPALSPPFLFES